MLNEIRKLFRRSADAFREALETGDPEDQVAELLVSMRRELVAARAALPVYAEEIERLERAIAGEREELGRVERRRELAQRIEDAETVRVADDFATRHRERIGVLEQRLTAARAELELRTREADEMKRRYQEADANRFGLLAQLRTAGARERMRSALGDDNGPASDFDRMAERVTGNAAYADALEELSADDRPPPPPRNEPGEIERRLEELKRKMGQ